MQTETMSYGKFFIPEWTDQLNLRPGLRKTFECLVLAARGQERAWPEQEWLAAKANITTRTVRSHIRALEKKGVVKTVMERINGQLRLVYYFLAHPVAVAARDRKNFPVTEEKFSGHLNKRKKNIKSPPTPPQGEAAGAAEERENEKAQTQKGSAAEDRQFRTTGNLPRDNAALPDAVPGDAGGEQGSFLNLTNHLRQTGRWPDMEQLASGEYCYEYSRQKILHCLGTLEETGFLNLTERRTRFPIARLNADQDALYLKLINICASQEEATITLDNLIEDIFEDYQQHQMLFEECQKQWEMLNFLRRKSQSEQLEQEEQEMLDMLVYLHPQEPIPPRAATREEVKRQLGVLKKRGLLRVQATKTENGKAYMYQLLPTADLAEQLVFNDWDNEPWVKFSLPTNRTT